MISLSIDPTIPKSWGAQMIWWRYSAVPDFVTHQLFWQADFFGYFGRRYQ